VSQLNQVIDCHELAEWQVFYLLENEDLEKQQRRNELDHSAKKNMEAMKWRR